MARGKNKAIAERRNLALAELGTATEQAHQIEKLQKENNALLAKINIDKAHYEQLIIDLNKRLETNSSNLVLEYRKTIDELKNELIKSEDERNKIKDHWSKLVSELVTKLQETPFNLSPIEAYEQFLALVSDNKNAVVIEGVAQTKGLSKQAILAIQKARGIR